MRLYQNWISRAANVSSFILMLLMHSGGPHGRCQADQTQPALYPQVVVATSKLSSGSVGAGARKGEQHTDLPSTAMNPAVDSKHQSTISHTFVFIKEGELLMELRQVGALHSHSSASAPIKGEVPVLNWLQHDEKQLEQQLHQQQEQQQREKGENHLSRDLKLGGIRGNGGYFDEADSECSGEFSIHRAMPAGSGSHGVIAGADFGSIQQLESLTGASSPLQSLNCTGAISEAEYQALQDLYLATGGTNWTWHNISSGKSQWVFNSNPTAPCSDSWEGVYCAECSDPTEPSVFCTIVDLMLPFTNLRGQLPASIGNLKQLETLTLQNNHLEGCIPSSLGNLTALTILGLNENSLTGPIPSSLGDLTALTELYLYENSLTGPIPSSLGDLMGLVILGLKENSLTGPIPTSLGNLTALTELYLYENSLTGPIPSSLGNLTALTQLYLYENSLTGSIPKILGDWTALTTLGLNQNSLTGRIPSSLGNLTALTILALNQNSLTGFIPSSLGNLTALMQLALYENSLAGPIPSSFGNMTALTQLALYANSLTGPIPSVLGCLTALTQLYLNENSLVRPVPSSLGHLTALSQVYLHENLLTGSIPSSLGKLKSLTQLKMSRNSLIGTIPSSLGFLGKCFYFNISSNSLTGSIPAELGKVGSNLSFADKLVGAGVALDLSQNVLSGTLSPLLFSKQMQTILLYSNCMQGSVPTGICSSSYLQTLVLDKLTSGPSCQSRLLGFKATFASTTLQGSIPECIWTMPQLQTIHFAGNGLHGTLGNIGSISSLINVDLSNNFLSGALPTSLQTQQSLQQIALANNKLSGILSRSFNTGNLTLLVLTVNRLSGDIPAFLCNTPDVTKLSILTGNLFACGSLPSADPASSSYVCGSEILNTGLYFSGCALLVLVSLAVVAFLFAGGFSFWAKLWHDGIDHLKAANLHRLIDVVDALKVRLCTLELFYLVIAMPSYVTLKSVGSAGTLAEQYTWVTTSAYLHGYAAAAIVGLFILFSGIVFVLVMQRLELLLKPSPTGASRSQLSVEPEHLNLRYVLQRVLMQICSLIIVLVVNVLYVYGVVFGGLSTSEQLVTQGALGLFKLLWQQLVVTRAILWIATNHGDISVGGLIFHQVTMNAVSFIVAPCLATLGTDSDCLYYALQSPQPISSSFNVTIFNTECITTIRNGDSITNCIEYPFQQLTTISDTPSWFYSYQCSSVLLTNYIPVLLLIFVTSASVPLLWHLFDLVISRYHGSKITLLTFLHNQEPPSFRKPFADILLDLLVLTTFGLASPLLGLMIVFKQITTAVVTRMSIRRYLQHTEEPLAALASLEDAAQQFRGGDTRALLGYLLCVVGVFWGAMIFDMVADLYGDTAGGIAWALAFAVWATAALLAYWAKLGDRVAASLFRLFGRATGPGDDISTQSAQVNNSSHIQTEARNIIFAAETNNNIAPEDDQARIRKLNSEFGLEMTQVTRSDRVPLNDGAYETV